MKTRIFALFFGLLLLACSGDSEKDAAFLGNWEAQWRTLPESFPGMEDMDFTMSGKVKFSSDSVSITAYGYEGCIFSEDTLVHSLDWKVADDTLHLLNEADVYGMSYKVVSKSDQQIELQLMDDIFLTLTK
ncbi:MAG: hypothetical protein AAGA85_01740 [Bacteroidota bacterium]